MQHGGCGGGIGGGNIAAAKRRGGGWRHVARLRFGVCGEDQSVKTAPAWRRRNQAANKSKRRRKRGIETKTPSSAAAAKKHQRRIMRRGAASLAAKAGDNANGKRGIWRAMIIMRRSTWHAVAAASGGSKAAGVTQRMKA
jgi:hypothetical protein